MITPHHHSQSCINLDLLNLVNHRGQCSAAELFNQFCLDETSSAERRRMAAKLNYLVYSEQLCRRGKGPLALYWLGPLAGKPGSGVPRAKAKTKPERPLIAPQDSYLPEHVASFHIPVTTPAPTYNTMDAPPYVPGPGPVLRPGAMDYKRYATRGHRC